MGSLCFVIDGMSWCILRFNGRWLLSISCGKRQVTCREVRIFHLFNIEINNTFINTIWIIVSTWFVYDISLNNKFINSVVKVFFACIFKICRFYQFIINLAEIGAFMLFLQMIKNNKTLLSRMVRSISAMDAVAIVTVSKLLIYQIENFAIFIINPYWIKQ